MRKCVREEEMCERGRKWGVCVDGGDEEVCDGEGVMGNGEEWRWKGEREGKWEGEEVGEKGVGGRR